MPQVTVVYFRESDGHAPVRRWLLELRLRNPRAYAKCLIKIERLKALGHELRRPEADLLRDGIYELRAREGSVNYRILYFFHGRTIAVLGHALTKTDKVPPAEIERALRRKIQFEKSPQDHTKHEED